MAMTSRGIVKGNLQFSSPERIAFNFDGGRMNDFCGAGIGVEKQWDQWAYEAFVETQGLTPDSPL